MRNLTRSNEHLLKASTKLPLGVASNFRYWGDDKTIYVDHASGGRIWDIDGNEYVDYRMGYGPGILGYKDSRVDEEHDLYGLGHSASEIPVHENGSRDPRIERLHSPSHRNRDDSIRCRPHRGGNP